MAAGRASSPASIQGGTYNHGEGWIALAASLQEGRLYGLGRTGFLQAYRFDDRSGVVPVSAPAATRPIDSARVDADEQNVAICGDDGTVQIYWASGATLAKVADLNVGDGSVLPVR